jgi:hypothetical protein
MLEIFEEAAHFTMDNTLRDILLNCSMGIYPKQFTVDNGSIMVGTQPYTIPSDAMELTNLIHDIMLKKPRKTTPVIAPTTTTSTRIRNQGLSMDELYMFAMREAVRLGRNEEYGKKLWGCIYSCIYLETIAPRDIIYKDGKIVSINRIDTSIPEYRTT